MLLNHFDKLVHHEYDTNLTIIFYIVAVIGFNQTAYTFEEGDDGSVEVCAVFLQPRDPSRIVPIVVELMGSTSPDTADG